MSLENCFVSGFMCYRSISAFSPRVLMVVGAGRGPLVRRALAAAKAGHRKIKIYAVEKNPNAVVTLQAQQDEDWGDQVIRIFLLICLSSSSILILLLLLLLLYSTFLIQYDSFQLQPFFSLYSDYLYIMKELAVDQNA